MLLVQFLPTTIISKGKTYYFKCIKIKNIFIIADSAYQGIQNIHNNSIILEKKVINAWTKFHKSTVYNINRHNITSEVLYSF